MQLLRVKNSLRHNNIFKYLLVSVVLCVVTILHVYKNNRPMMPTVGRPSSLKDENEIDYRLRGPLKHDDNDLINLIRRDYLIPPPSKQVPYNLRHVGVAGIDHGYKHVYPAWIWINNILEDFYPPDRRGGFFVEAGALDGEYLSNTLRLEMEQGWTGLLVEPDNDNFKLLLATKRKAWLTPTCLSLHNYPETAVLSKLREGGTDVNWLMRATTFIIKNDDVASSNGHDKFTVLFDKAQCLPTQSLLMALNVSHVDFFSLDIELVEEPVLDTFPFDRITVDVWAIEHRREELPQRFENETLQTYTLADLKNLNMSKEVIEYREQLIREFEDERFIKIMIARGYYYFDCSCAFVGDYIFVRKASDLYKMLQVPHQKENRTEICKYKQIHASNRAHTTNEDLRDPHHYPDLQYRDI